jgi:hypothetical protein
MPVGAAGGVPAVEREAGRAADGEVDRAAPDRAFAGEMGGADVAGTGAGFREPAGRRQLREGFRVDVGSPLEQTCAEVGETLAQVVEAVGPTGMTDEPVQILAVSPAGPAGG